MGIVSRMKSIFSRKEVDGQFLDLERFVLLGFVDGPTGGGRNPLILLRNVQIL